MVTTKLNILPLMLSQNPKTKFSVCVAACPCNGDQSVTPFNLSFLFCQWDLVVEAYMCLAASCVKDPSRVLNSHYIFQYPGRYSLGAKGLKS